MGRFLILLLGVLLFTGCAKLKPIDFSQAGPHLELDHFFNGPVESWGVYEDLAGNPKLYFKCHEFGSLAALGDLVIHQEFTYSNGKKQLRDWHLHRLDGTHWMASCQQMIGVAKGETVGNALYWEYDYRINPTNPLTTVHIRQWMYQTEANTLMVRLFVSKFGVPIGQGSECIHKN